MKQQGFGFTRTFGLFLATIVLTSCSGNPLVSEDGDSILRNKTLDYATSKVIDRIVVPQGLNDDQVQNDLLTIPAAQLVGQSTGIESAPRPDFVFAEAGSDSAYFTGGANLKRISVAGSLTKVQGQVAQFWSNQGIALDTISGPKVIETEWFSLSNKGKNPLSFAIKGILVFAALGYNAYLRGKLLKELKTNLFNSYSTMRYGYYTSRDTGHFISILNERKKKKKSN